MSLKIDRVQLEIIVQQDSARQKMLELEQRMRDANKELGRIKKQFGANSEEYKAQQVVIRNLKIEYDKLFEEIGLGNLSMSCDLLSKLYLCPNSNSRIRSTQTHSQL